MSRLAIRERDLNGSGALVIAALVWGLALPLLTLRRRAEGAAKSRLSWGALVTATALTVPLLYLGAGRPKEIELAFETIE